MAEDVALAPRKVRVVNGLLAIMALSLCAACGGGGGSTGSTGSTNSGTPSGTYAITVSASSSGVVETIPLKLTVQ